MKTNSFFNKISAALLCGLVLGCFALVGCSQNAANKPAGNTSSSTAVKKNIPLGDTYKGIGRGSRWEEIQAALGKPKAIKKNDFDQILVMEYDGIVFNNFYSKGAASKEIMAKWKSVEAATMCVTKAGLTMDSGVKIGMSKNEVDSILQKANTSKEFKSFGDMARSFSLKNTKPSNMFLNYKNGKLARYMMAPH